MHGQYNAWLSCSHSTTTCTWLVYSDLVTDMVLGGLHSLIGITFLAYGVVNKCWQGIQTFNMTSHAEPYSDSTGGYTRKPTHWDLWHTIGLD